MPERRRILAASALALALNLAGIGWGLPSRFHPDEKADVVAAMVREGRLLPDSYVNPSLPLALTAPVVALQQGLLGSLPPPWSDPLLAARALSALVGAASVLLLGLAGARVRPAAGVAAALLLALAPGVVNLCHFATPEAWVLATTSLVLLLAVRHVECRAPAWALGAGLGLAVSTKYTAAALAVPVLAALWLRPREPAGRADRAAWLLAGLAALAASLALAGAPGASLAASLRLADARLLHPESARAFVRGLSLAGRAAGAGAIGLLALRAFPRAAGLERTLVRREVVVAFLAAAAAFALGTPGAALEPRAFLSDLAFNAQTRHEYKGLVGEATSWGAYLHLAADALTWPALAAAALGLALAVARAWRGSRALLVVALAALAPYALVASSGHRAMRFLAPALPAAVWLAALALAGLPRRRERRLLTAALLARSAVAAVLVVRLFFVDSRLLAGRWMEAHVPPGAAVDLITNHEGYAPRVPEGRVARVVRTLSREMAPPERFEEAARAYPSEAAEWLVLTSAFYERFLDHPDQRPERARFFREVLEGRGGFAVAARFRQEGWRRPEAEFLDPTIVVLRKRSGGGGAQRDPAPSS
jgi:4-amino-4-deoxy-L-arabinose transferase-like glycosyltransferase